MLTSLRQVTSFLLLMALVTGIAYPLVIAGGAKLLFPDQARGSLIERDGHVVGSSLIGQSFTGARYFNSRPSAAGKDGYDASSSSGSNLGVATKALNDTIAERVFIIRRSQEPVPADLVMASASGLDPHLSPAAALYQIERVAIARDLPRDRVEALVREHTEGRQLGFLGEPRVNLLQLNLALDRLDQTRSEQSAD